MDTTLREGINWVGYVDWTVRDFHGYSTERGSTYNAYLVQDEKTALIDTVKSFYADELIAHVAALTDPQKVDYVIANHAEPDHAGSLPAVLAAFPNAELVCDKRCREALAKHFDISDWTIRVVAEGDSISLGNRTLTFVETPMVHWPESMFTYCPEEKVLFSMDAFGQHYASSHRFDDEEPLDIVLEEAKTYYANIVMLYAGPISRVLGKAADLDIEMIAPSHGVIWRSHIEAIVSRYRQWVNHEKRPKVMVIYDTMWKSTETMAHAIMEGAAQADVDAKLFNVRASNITILATEVLDTACLAVGSSTLNQTVMPQIAAVLTYFKGLKPVGKAGLVFGSYGWAEGASKEINAYFDSMKVDVIREPVCSQFVPSAECLEECREAGRLLAAKAREIAGND